MQGERFDSAAPLLRAHGLCVNLASLGALGGLLLGELLGAIACMLVANWIIPGVFGWLLVAQPIWVWRSEKEFAKRVGEQREMGALA